MSGTTAGGIKARDKNIKNHGKDYYRVLGHAGGLKGKKDGVIKGFALNRQLAREAGRKGGKISRRTKSSPKHWWKNGS